MKTYLCDLCPGVFRRSDNLSRHMSDYHKSNKVVCEQCGKDFTRNDNLKRHAVNCKATKGKYFFIVLNILF